MKKEKNNNQGRQDEFDKDDGVNIRDEEPSIAEFTKRPVPNDQEVEKFEEYIDEASKEANEIDFDSEINGVNDEEIEESLEEIYQDDKGNRVDVKKMQVLKKRGVIFWIFSLLFTAGAVAVLTYSGYNFYMNSGSDVTTVDFFVDTESEVVAGQEFYYNIHYKNNSKIDILLPRLEAIFPENFIIVSSEPASQSQTKGLWDLPTLPPGRENIVKVKGMIIAKEGDTGVMFANLSYTPQNFSSEFKKETSATTLVRDIGVEINIDYIKTALVGDTGEITVNLNSQEENYLDSFIIKSQVPENFEWLDLQNRENTGQPDEASAPAEGGGAENAVYEKIKDGKWAVNGLTEEESVLTASFSFQNKKNSEEAVKLTFEKEAPDNESYVFYENDLVFEVMKSDLNLALIINGSRENQGINFGDKLLYSIVYNNKGETAMKDVVIMAVLEGDFLDWASLEDEAGAEEKGNTLTWTKNQIPKLALVDKHEEGTIDFSINVMDAGQVEPGQEYELKSYVQFSVGGSEDGARISEDNKSNEIINLINSDLSLEEQLRYFNEDNITVGNGPLPLRIGEKTSFKVYWSITNNLHELNEVSVEASLPEYVSWDNKNRTNVGAVSYDEERHRVVWDIGRLPLTVFRADAEFNVSVIPRDEDLNTIIVIKPGSKISAVDSETGDKIEKITDVKTSKLEDDEISQKTNDGVVRN